MKGNKTPVSKKKSGINPFNSSQSSVSPTKLLLKKPTVEAEFVFNHLDCKEKKVFECDLNISPCKTPVRTKLIHSPQKRSIFELDKSARKKAINQTNFFSNEENEEDEVVREQNRKIADAILADGTETDLNQSSSSDDGEEFLKHNPILKSEQVGKSRNYILDLSDNENEKEVKESKELTSKEIDTSSEYALMFFDIYNDSPDTTNNLNNGLETNEQTKKSNKQSNYSLNDVFNEYCNNKNDLLCDFEDKPFFLEGPEGYFEQHCLKVKPSLNSLSQLEFDVDYNDFLSLVTISELILEKEKFFLYELHKYLFNQWCFELSQGFNLIFFGIGSKRDILDDFVQNYFFDWFLNVFENGEVPKVMVINGYNPKVKIKTVLNDIIRSLIDNSMKNTLNIFKSITQLCDYFEKHRQFKFNNVVPKLILVIHNIDGESLRNENTQCILSELCSIPDIWLLTSIDNIGATLMWNSSKLKNFNFLWHDLTTYKHFIVETSFKDVLNLGKSKNNIGSKGSKYVLSSLNKNSQNIYKILLKKQILIMKESSKNNIDSVKGSIKHGLDLNVFYQICFENFITFNEINFRTVLVEFIEHKMCKIVKNEAGIEYIFIPFKYKEMKKIYKDEFENVSVS